MAAVANGNVLLCVTVRIHVSMSTDGMEIDDGPDMDMGGGYYSDNDDNTTPKSHLAIRRVSHMLLSDSCHVKYNNSLVGKGQG